MPNQTALVLGCAMALAVLGSPAYSHDAAISSAIDYCRGYPKAITLSDDKNILCFDGTIDEDEGTAPFQDLEPNGMFVIRSTGGYTESAMTIANILRDKNARVIIYDYCFSACANWILVATNETFVAKKTIVAWHGGPTKSSTAFQFMDWMAGLRPSSDFICLGTDEDVTVIDEKIAVLMKSGVRNLKQEKAKDRRRAACKASEMHREFFTSRGIDDGYIYEPQTQATKDLYDAAAKDRGRRTTLWMWNPRHHGNYFRTNIIYESYPESQSEVDEIFKTFRFRGTVIYDP
jgi:hypothetical protein